MTSKHERREKLINELNQHSDADKVLASVKLLENYMLDVLPARADQLKHAGYQILLANALDQKQLSSVLNQYPEIKSYIVSADFKKSDFFTELNTQQKKEVQAAISDELNKTTFGNRSQQSSLFHSAVTAEKAPTTTDNPQPKPKKP